MQIFTSEFTIPQRLTCSGCRHWEQVIAAGPEDAEPAGRCGRFGEIRPAGARPRCNICWEPASVTSPAQDEIRAEH